MGSIRKNALAYQSNKAITKSKSYSAMKHKSCISEPLIGYDDSCYVLDIIPPMQLHLMLGIVNRLYNFLDKVLVASKNSMKAKDWSDKLSISRRHYWGGEFIGNQCSKLLDNVDILERMLVEAEAFAAIPYVDALRSFKRVKDSCFSFELLPGYDKAIEDFKHAYQNLGIPVSLKVHIVFEHIIQFCKKYYKRLGFFSEHGLESSHYDFHSFWEKSYKLPMIHPNYPEKMLQSVIMYNALHL